MTKKSTKHFVNALIWNQYGLSNASQHELEVTIHVDVLTNGRVARGPRATVGPSPHQLNQNQVPTWSGSKKIYYEFAVNLTINTRDTLIQRLSRRLNSWVFRYVFRGLSIRYDYYYASRKHTRQDLNHMTTYTSFNWVRGHQDSWGQPSVPARQFSCQQQFLKEYYYYHRWLQEMIL